MSAELIAIIAAAVSLGGLVIARTASIDVRLRAVETELAFMRGLLRGGGLVLLAKPEPPATKGAA